MHAFSDRKFCCNLHRRSPSTAGALEDVHREVAFYLIERRTIPIAELSVFIEERNFAPLTFICYEFRAWNRPGGFKHAPEIGIAKAAENAAKLVEEFSAVIVVLRRRDLPLPL